MQKGRVEAACLTSLSLATIYRSWVTYPLGCDVYLLYLPGVIFLPLLLMLLICLVVRGKKAALPFVLGAVMFFGWLIPMGRTVETSSLPQDTLRLVTLNTDAYHSDLATEMEIVKDLNPDFICLQEVWKRKQLDQVQQQLPGYRFWIHPEDDDVPQFFHYGTIVGVKAEWNGTRISSPKGVTTVNVQRGQTVLTVASIHGLKVRKYDVLSALATAELQASQAKELLGTLPENGQATLVAGDFNAPSSGPALKILSKRHHSAFIQAGRGLCLTFPAKFPVIGIDHVFGSSAVRFESFQTIQAGSDHLGIVVDFSLK